MIGPAKPKVEIWTRRQRRTLLGLCLMVLFFLLIERSRKPIELNDPPENRSRADQVQHRLDPNTADAVALSAIPNLGENRAQQIVDYRQNFARQHPGTPAFKTAADLMRIKGIGPGIAADIEPYLMFP